MNNQTIPYFMPDSGNTNQVLANSPPTVRLQYPLAEPIKVTSFAAFITTLLPVNSTAAVIFRLLQNGFSLVSIFFGPGDGAVPKVISLPNLPFAAGDLLTVQVEVDNFPPSIQVPETIASATVGYI